MKKLQMKTVYFIVLSILSIGQIWAQTNKESVSGIGIYLNTANDTIRVIKVLDYTPAQKAGLQTDDNIIKIDGKNVVGVGIDSATEKIRGKKGTPVKLLVKRDGVSQLLDFNIVRDDITASTDTQSAEYWRSKFEVWGIPKSEQKAFIQKIIDNYNGEFDGIIHSEVVRELGYSDAEVLFFGIARQIITLRKKPDYHTYFPEDKYPKPSAKTLKKWQDFSQNLDQYSKEFAYVSFIIGKYNKAERDRLFAEDKLKPEFISNIKKAEKYAKSFLKKTNQNELFSVLIHANPEEYEQLFPSIITAMFYFTQTEDDVLQLLPLSLLPQEKDGVIYEFFKKLNRYNPERIATWKTKIKWENHADLLTDLLNHPSPIRVGAIVWIAEKIGTTEKYMENTPLDKLITIKEILNSNFVKREQKQEFIKFIKPNKRPVTQ